MNKLMEIIRSESVVAAAKTLGKAILYATLSALGVNWLSGCSSASQAPHGQTTEIVAIGLPAVAWISHTAQTQENRAGSTNGISQINPVTTVVPIN